MFSFSVPGQGEHGVLSTSGCCEPFKCLVQFFHSRHPPGQPLVRRADHWWSDQFQSFRWRVVPAQAFNVLHLLCHPPMTMRRSLGASVDLRLSILHMSGLSASALPGPLCCPCNGSALLTSLAFRHCHFEISLFFQVIFSPFLYYQ